jgi:hypothetical protein
MLIILIYKSVLFIHYSIVLLHRFGLIENGVLNFHLKWMNSFIQYIHISIYRETESCRSGFWKNEDGYSCFFALKIIRCFILKLCRRASLMTSLILIHKKSELFWVWKNDLIWLRSFQTRVCSFILKRILIFAFFCRETSRARRAQEFLDSDPVDQSFLDLIFVIFLMQFFN